MKKRIIEALRKAANRHVIIETPILDVYSSKGKTADLYQVFATDPIFQITENAIYGKGDFGLSRTEAVGGIKLPFSRRRFLPLSKPKIHTGVDINAPPETPVGSTLEGKIVEYQTGFGKKDGRYDYSNTDNGKHGNYVVIEHELEGRKLRTKYSHLSKLHPEIEEIIQKQLKKYHPNWDSINHVDGFPVVLNKEDQISVKKRQILGYVGMTGNAANEPIEDCHLHFEVYRVLDDKYHLMDPKDLYPNFKVVPR